ncbi:hypothetical protein HMPREF1861_00733 [Corynebacterium kroppenstedtii]|nr:hypothetical protein HMPREF1861_00733 [Corynebacterium kroppenstedtii]
MISARGPCCSAGAFCTCGARRLSRAPVFLRGGLAMWWVGCVWAMWVGCVWIMCVV